MYQHDGDGIGTYNEKRFHRIFKRFVTDDAECYEVKIGKYIADVLKDGHVTEIQTTSFGKLAPKIKYYLTETELDVTVVLPLICEKRVIRADKQTGEVRSIRRSPLKVRAIDSLAHLYYLREAIGADGFEVRLMLVKADEYRYSERVRYRKKGVYDKDTYPTELVQEVVLKDREDYIAFVPQTLWDREFDAKEYSSEARLCGRGLYSALNTLYEAGILDRRKSQKKYVYRLTKI